MEEMRKNYCHIKEWKKSTTNVDCENEGAVCTSFTIANLAQMKTIVMIRVEIPNNFYRYMYIVLAGLLLS